MKLIQMSVSVVLVGILCGCSSLPDAKVAYYLAQTKVKFKVVRTVACDENNNPLVANAVTPSAIHSADLAQFYSVGLANLNGTFSDADVKFDFYEDGRLKNINSTSTGQGEAILKTASTVAGAVLAIKELGPNYSKECAFIKQANGGKPLTLTYEGDVNLSQKNVKQNIPPDAGSEFYASNLLNAIGSISAIVEETQTPSAPTTYTGQKDDVLLNVRQPGLVHIKVTSEINGVSSINPLWDDKLPVAQFGTTYVLPIPKPAAFGKKVFAASFSESGALSSVQYVSNTGTGQALNALNSSITSLQGETTAQKAADVKAEADLILQQQRLIQCKADPKLCK